MEHNQDKCELKKMDDDELLITEYFQQLSPIHKKAYLIAQSHLKSSFDVVRSNGYIEWLHKRNK